MKNQNQTNAVYLFDEFGTPTFNKEREFRHFVGVSVIYMHQDELQLFNSVDKLFGLSNIKSLKNNRIGNTRALDIANQLAILPITLTIVHLDLDDVKLQNDTLLFQKFGTEMRKIHRNLKGKPVSQILYTQILNNSNMLSIKQLLERYPGSYNLDLFIDNWSFPVADFEIETVDRANYLKTNVNSILQDYGDSITTNKIRLLDEDSKRKRFIDVIASSISRSYFEKNDERYQENILKNILHSKTLNSCQYDITAQTTDFFIDFMNKNLRAD